MTTKTSAISPFSLSRFFIPLYDDENIFYFSFFTTSFFLFIHMTKKTSSIHYLVFLLINMTTKISSTSIFSVSRFLFLYMMTKISSTSLLSVSRFSIHLYDDENIFYLSSFSISYFYSFYIFHKTFFHYDDVIF